MRRKYGKLNNPVLTLDIVKTKWYNSVMFEYITKRNYIS